MHQHEQETTNNTSTSDPTTTAVKPMEPELPSVTTSTTRATSPSPSSEEDPLPLSSFFYPVDLATPTPTVISEDQQADLFDLQDAPPLLLSVLDYEDEEGEGEAGGISMSKPVPLPRPAPLEGPTLTQDLMMRANASTTNNNTTTNEDSQRCLIDFVEWWCYKIITAATASTSTTNNQSEVRQMSEYREESIKACENLFSGNEEATSTPTKPSFGRLNNRLRLAALSLDVAMMKTVNSDQDKPPMPLDQHWKALQEELILMKNMLLRQDANADIVLVPPQDRQAFANATPNLQLDQNPLFQAHYKKVLRLLQVQYHLCVFHGRLVELAKDNTDITEQDKKQRVRQAIEDYEKHINHLFTTAAAASTQTTSNTNSNSSGSEQDDTVSIQSVSSHDVRALPSELVGFLLKDLYQTSMNKASPPASPSSNNSLAARLLRHVESILTADRKHPYSHVSTQRALHSLLAQWQELVLEEPTLVQLGYGDVSSSTSSPRKRQAEAEEDAMLRRLSSCGGQPMENVSDIGEEDDDDDDEEREEQRPTKKPKILPWNDDGSSSSDSDANNQQQQEQ